MVERRGTRLAEELVLLQAPRYSEREVKGAFGPRTVGLSIEKAHPVSINLLVSLY